MKILITGSAGFIGSNFLFYMLKKYPDYQFVCIDKLTYAGNISTLSNVLNKSNVKFIQADICNEKHIDEIFAREVPEIIVNFAAESHVDHSINNPRIFFKSNTLGVAVLLDACRKYGIQRYHQISTDEVYGDIPLDCFNMEFLESTLLQANSPYASSKASADLLAMSYQKTFGVPVTISRCSNNFGPYQYPEKLIPLMIVNALKNESLPIYGNGLNVRNWLYVEDHCSAVDLIIHKGKSGEIYNVSGEKDLTNIEVVKSILHVLNKSENLISYVPDRRGHDQKYVVNSNKIRKELGWVPRYDFETALHFTIKWYQNNSAWWEPLLKK